MQNKCFLCLKHQVSTMFSEHPHFQETTKDSRTKRKIIPYTSAFRPSIPSSPCSPSTPHISHVTSLATNHVTSRTTHVIPRAANHMITSSPLTTPQEAVSLHSTPPPSIKPIPDHQKVYYVSGLELLSWVSSKVDRLEVPAKQEPCRPGIFKQESR